MSHDSAKLGNKKKSHEAGGFSRGLSGLMRKMHNPFNLYAAICIIGHLTISFLVIEDYGITIDAPDDVAIGLKYLNYFETGHLDFSDNTPSIPGHPVVYSDTSVATKPYYAYPFANTLSALTCKIFYQKLRLLDPVASHHIMIPLLLAGFMGAFYVFVKKYWGGYAALLAILLLATYPRFIGDSFNNLKDVPLAIFFSLTIMCYVEWRETWRKVFLYGAAAFFAFGFVTKPDVVLTLFIILPWEIVRWKIKGFDRRIWRFDIIKHYALAAILSGMLAWVLYPPLHPWYPHCWQYFTEAIDYMKGIATWENAPWNIYAPEYIWYTSPVPVLLIFFTGFCVILFKWGRSVMNPLLVVWVLFPVLRHCLPGTNHYDGLRHFLMFVIPFSIISALGAEAVVNHLCPLFRHRWMVVSFVSLVCIGSGLYPTIKVHPFQTTYFNGFMGGLEGAQAVDYPYACDYWGNSLRQAGEWLDLHAKPNASYYAVVATRLLRWSVDRNDLKEIKQINSVQEIPPNTYFVVIPRKHWGGLVVQTGMVSKWTFFATRYKLVHRIERQGGEIFSIYYNP